MSFKQKNIYASYIPWASSLHSSIVVTFAHEEVEKCVPCLTPLPYPTNMPQTTNDFFKQKFCLLSYKAVFISFLIYVNYSYDIILRAIIMI